jgi:hypothetical protein
LTQGRTVNGYPGPPMTLGNAAAAHVRLIVWCEACQHQVEPEPAEQITSAIFTEMAVRYGAETPRSRLARAAGLFPLRQPAGRYGGASEMRPQPVTAAAPVTREWGEVFSSCFQLPLVRTSLFGLPRGPLEPLRILPAAPDLPEEVVLVSNSGRRDRYGYDPCAVVKRKMGSHLRRVEDRSSMR